MTDTEIKREAARLELERAELKPYFDQVCRKDDWKAPIDAYCRREDFPMVQRAIGFFTATTASSKNVKIEP